MTDRFLFIYFMKNLPDLVRQVVPDHVRYWHEAEVPGYVGGPFADRSGGAISFKARTRAEAKELVASDPFVTEDLLSESWLKEWHTE